MGIPEVLINKVRSGRSILFIGSGGLIGADLNGKSIPLGDGLRDLLNVEYLGGEYQHSSLAHVAALAISQTSLYEVQDYIKEYFRDISPAEFHNKIPEFKWRAIFTTNYDRLVEKCYSNSENSIQNLEIILSNSDSFDESRVTNDIVPFFKLHGCVTRTHDHDLPLILTIDQYNEYLHNRKRLFLNLYELAYDNPIIFIGHSLLDQDIRKVILELRKDNPQGQRHYLLKPGVKDVEKSYWEEKRITALSASFEEFINSIDVSIEEHDRKLALVLPSSNHPINDRMTGNHEASKVLLRFLTDHAEFLSDATTYKAEDPKDFYRGTDLGWYPVAEDLCIERTLYHALYQRVVQFPEEEREQATELFVIKGEAGSGKSMLLRQLAWNAKALGIGIFIWVKQGVSFDISILQELHEKTSERIFVLWDDAARNLHVISKLLNQSAGTSIPITIVTAERYNEWNTRCYDLEPSVTDALRVHYLSVREIESLVLLLEKHDSLGPNLIKKSFQERVAEFKETAGRQLLVALYEATMGKPFENIIFDEYLSITPQSAKDLYLTVCTLNRLRIPVRAGLISRIHDISFSSFKNDFFKPLESIVQTIIHSEGDAHYEARHPEIAEIVFRKVLVDSVERYNEYIRILKKINLSFESDRSSFRLLVKAKTLMELFPSYDDVKSIYDICLEELGDDSYLFQQIANYERIRPNGNYSYAIELLEKARELAPRDNTIIHSLAVVWRDRANEALETHVRLKYRGESRAFLEKAAQAWGDDSYIANTLIELALDDLSDLLNDDTSTTRSLDEAIRRTEEKLLETKRKHPNNGHIYNIESNFAKLLKDNHRAITALEKSFSQNNRDPFIASRLASFYLDSGDIDRAKSTLEGALSRRRADPRLNYQFAELLRQTAPADYQQLIYFYRRAYTPGDGNYHAQFWHARYLMESEDRSDYSDAVNLFKLLRNARVPFDARIEIRDYHRINGEIANNDGELIRKLNGFGFVRVDGSGRELFCPGNCLEGDDWELLEIGDRLVFNIGYSFKGPTCCNVTIAGSNI